MLVGTLVTLVAGLIPAWRATRVPPVAALRDADPGAHKVRLPARAVRGLGVAARPSGRGARRLRRRAGPPQRDAPSRPHRGHGVGADDRRRAGDAGHGDRAGPARHDAGTLDERIAATHVITGADGWSPTDPAVARARSPAPGVTGVTAIRQDVGLAFGDKEIVNSVDPATIGKVSFEWTRRLRARSARRSAATARSSTRAGPPSTG